MPVHRFQCVCGYTLEARTGADITVMPIGSRTQVTEPGQSWSYFSCPGCSTPVNELLGEAMTAKREQKRKALIGKIHLAKTQLGMAEDSYRAHLKFYGKKDSCADMAIFQLEAVLEAMIKLGFKPVLKTAKKRYSPPTKTMPEDERSAIRAIWVFMAKHGFVQDGSETALNGWVQRMTAQYNGGEGVAEVQWLHNYKHVGKLLNAIKYWCRRCMFQELQKQGVTIHGQASYVQVLERFEKYIRSIK